MSAGEFSASAMLAREAIETFVEIAWEVAPGMKQMELC
jgi:hypothetical protein